MATYYKTAKGNEAMAAGPSGGLMLQDRRILILSDGRRTLEQLRAMLGNDILARVQRLERDGYLMTTPPAGAASTIAPAKANGPTPPAAAKPPADGQRRSLAASKMYLLDMLQLQRSAEAAELSAAIRCAVEPERQLDAILDGLRHILASSKPSYGERVAQRLAATLPTQTLPRLETLLPATETRPRLTIVA